MNDLDTEFAAAARQRKETRNAGEVEGRHFTDYVGRVKQLEKVKQYDEAEKLLLELVEATEREAGIAKHGVAPWYYERLAVIYRKQGRNTDEVAVLERYAKQPKALGVGPSKLSERLTKARKLLKP